MQRALAATLGAAALLVLGAVPAGAATHQTWHLWSKQTSSLAFDAAGNQVTDPNAQPTVGFVFAGADSDYLGNHKKHSRKAVGTDHLSCTVTELDLASSKLMTLCYGQIALPGGMVLFDHQTVNFAQNPTHFTITGGTGKYHRATGTLTADSYGDSNNNTDLTLSVSF